MGSVHVFARERSTQSASPAALGFPDELHCKGAEWAPAVGHALHRVHVLAAIKCIR
eukprot:CAMPEP_0119430238 /NCGR_PEP_ID=MMETSP1335-20130426/43705_1 /TAXON_ID=259385 /ORGANISM="Chrysoculter rhomboideus, Strain RCC1486" /LENGTH=55 /DNA_ID=CAMNT_0007455991 /DNA_START=88 /DNA_END=251 /DNA_ORIENTATION=+